MTKGSDTLTALISVKELASKLDVTDALLKKLVKDFEIPTQKVKNRNHLDDDGVDHIKRILDLKSEGKKTKEIKELFAEQDGPKEAEEETPKAKGRKSKKAEKKVTKKTKAEEPEEEQEEAEEEKPKAKSKARKEKPEKKPSRKSNLKSAPKGQGDPMPSNVGDIDINEYIKDELAEEDADEMITTHTTEEVIKELDEGELDLEDEDLEEIEEEPLVQELEEDKSQPKKRRRKSFNFRYAQRQIAFDSKRIKYIRHRLAKSNISTSERMSLEDALDRRSKLLDGWLHILRWIKTR